MRSSLTCHLKPYIQPFERQLAYRELEALTCEPLPESGHTHEIKTLLVNSSAPAHVLARELAFWQSVSNGKPVITKQVRREATSVESLRSNSIQLVFDDQSLPEEIALPNRRCLRYGPHGLHEYRGKFFPQLVRAFINIGHVPPEGIIADPFSGSGTTAIETVLADRIALGLDLNPLSVFMSQTKCDILSVAADALESAFNKIKQDLQRSSAAPAVSWLSRLVPEDQQYLSEWFYPAVLKDLDRVAAGILAVDNVPVQNFMWLCVSNVLRRVSWQKEADLRVRRELKEAGKLDPINEFLTELDRSTRLMSAFLRQEQRFPKGSAVIKQGDSKRLPQEWKRWRGKVDAIITSPPYATALPYLDTDRLSLCFLGLLNRSQHRTRDLEMIGNREITDRMRKELWQAFSDKNATLPSSISSLIMKIYELNEGADVGFRRRNLPALLYKYFCDMSKVFEGMVAVLKKGAMAFVVVGNNHTIAGGTRIEINTIELLRELAELNGFETVDQLDMEMLTSRDIFKKNAIDSESILQFRKRD